MVCLKTLVKKSSILRDARFKVEHNGDVYCIDCIGDERIYISKDDITKEQGEMLPIHPEKVKFHMGGIATNKRIISFLREEGYDPQAELLTKIPH